MKILNKIICIVVVISFCFSSVSFASDPAAYNLSAPSKFSTLGNMQTYEFRDAAQIQAGVRSALADLGHIDLTSLRSLGKKSFAERTVFVHKISGILNFDTAGEYGINGTRIHLESGSYLVEAITESGRTYYCIISRPDEGGDTVVSVVPDRLIAEAAESGVLRLAHESVSEKDRGIINKYLEHEVSGENADALDAWIRKRMVSGEYSVGRLADMSLYQNTESIIERSQYSSIIENIGKNLASLGVPEANIEAVLANLEKDHISGSQKALVFIPYDYSDLPCITICGKRVSVTAHSSTLATYVFLPRKPYLIVKSKSVWNDNVVDTVQKALTHECGAQCGLRIAVKNGELRNELDDVIDEMSSGNQPAISDRLLNLAPVNLLELELRNDYADGFVRHKRRGIFQRILASIIGAVLAIIAPHAAKAHHVPKKEAPASYSVPAPVKEPEIATPRYYAELGSLFDQMREISGYGSSSASGSKDKELAVTTITDYRPYITGLTTWLVSHTNSQTGLPYSHVGDPRLANWSFTYDAAITAQAYMMSGNIDAASQIIDYYRTHRGIWRLGGIINAADASNAREGGKGIEWVVHTGPNAHLAMAALQIYARTNDARDLEFAQELAEFVLGLQNGQKSSINYGAVRMGPEGTDGPKDQHIGWDENLPSWYDVYSTEHNIDAWALLNMLYEITGQSRYRDMRDRIFNWLKRVAYNRNGGYFNRGYKERGWSAEPAGPDTIFASDVQFWAVSALGPEWLDKIEPGLAAKLMQVTERNSRVTVTYSKPNGQKVTISGFDYISQLQGPDRRPVVTPEWSFEGANAYTRLSVAAAKAYQDMANSAQRRGEKEKADEYGRKAQDIISNIMALAENVNGVMSLPYATRQGVPTGHGWNTPNCYASVIGAAYGVLAMTGYDPFVLGSGSVLVTIDSGNIVRSKPASSAGAIRTTSEDYIGAAWAAVNSGDWGRAGGIVEDMLRKHPDWVDNARTQERAMERRLGVEGSSPIAKSHAAMGWWPMENRQTVHKNWALNDLGTGYFIMMKAYYLAGDQEKALKCARTLLNDYPMALCWDPQGWFWNMVVSMQKEFRGLYNEASGSVGGSSGRDSVYAPPVPQTGRDRRAVTEKAGRRAPSSAPAGLKVNVGAAAHYGGSSEGWASVAINQNIDASDYMSIQLDVYSDTDGGKIIVQLLDGNTLPGSQRNTSRPYELKRGTNAITIPLSEFSGADLGSIWQIAIHYGRGAWGRPLNSRGINVNPTGISFVKDGRTSEADDGKDIEQARALSTQMDIILSRAANGQITPKEAESKITGLLQEFSPDRSDSESLAKALVGKAMVTALLLGGIRQQNFQYGQPDKDDIEAVASRIKDEKIEVFIPKSQLPANLTPAFKKALEDVFGDRLRPYQSVDNLEAMIKNPEKSIVMTADITDADIEKIENMNLGKTRFMSFEQMDIDNMSELELGNYYAEVLSMLLVGRTITEEEAKDPGSLAYRMLAHLLEDRMPNPGEIDHYIDMLTTSSAEVMGRLQYLLKTILKALPIQAYKVMKPAVEVLWSA